MLVKDLMSKNVVSVSPDESVQQAARLLERYNIGSLPVCSDDGRIKGVVTDRDITLRCVAAENEPGSTSVREIMSPSVVTVSPNDDIRQAAQLMSGQQIRRVPVVENGKVMGMLSLGDLARCHSCDMEAAQALSDISENVRHRR